MYSLYMAHIHNGLCTYQLTLLYNVLAMCSYWLSWCDLFIVAFYIAPKCMSH